MKPHIFSHLLLLISTFLHDPRLVGDLEGFCCRRTALAASDCRSRRQYGRLARLHHVVGRDCNQRHSVLCCCYFCFDVTEVIVVIVICVGSSVTPTDVAVVVVVVMLLFMLRDLGCCCFYC